MNTPISHGQDPKGVGSTAGAPPPSQGPNSGAPSGDSALMKAMLMQIEELTTLTNAAVSESALSVALRQSMQGKVTDTIEEYSTLLQFCSSHEGATFAKLQGLVASGASFSALEAAFPGAHLDAIPSDTRADFKHQLFGLIQGNPDPSKVSEFRTAVANIGPLLSKYGTDQAACKNLADAFQNGAGSLTQSITQFLAQLATESGLSSDIVAQ